MNKAIFLDRDGTINVDKGYVHKAEDLKFIDKAPEAIAEMKRRGYMVIVLSNQSGVARGYYGEQDVRKLHDEINLRLKEYGAYIDWFYFCPHHPAGLVGRYSCRCTCRKPEIGMLKQAVREHAVNIGESWVVGDRERDLFLSYEAPIRRILLSADADNALEGTAYKVRKNLWEFVQTDL